MSEKEKSIGVFDSGIGGLTVVRALMKKFPHENITYFGDTARVPYGSKSAEVVQEYSVQNAEFLMKQGVKMIVVACNTASSVAIDVLKARFDVPLVEMIIPGAEKALSATKNGRIGVIGTLATIGSQSYTKALQSMNPSLFILSKACPLFVPLAEEGWGHHHVASLVAEEYLHSLKKHGIDTLILGCTHYPVLKKVIQRAIGEEVYLVDSGAAAAKDVDKALKEKNIQNEANKEPNYAFFVSDVPQKFKELGEIFLGKKELKVTKVHI